MKKINILILLVAAISIIGSVLAYTKNEEDVWDDIENSYYCETTDTAEKGIKNKLDFDVVDGNVLNDNINKQQLYLDKLDIEILGGGTVNTSTITKFYKTKMSLSGKQEIEDFKQSVRNDGFFSTIEFDNEYWASAKRNKDAKSSTGIIKKDRLSQLFLNDNGEIYDINLDTNLKNRLSSSNLDLSKTKACFVLLRGLGETIVFDDGENQLIQVNCSYHNIIEEGTVFTIDELISEIDENIDELTLYENIVIEGAGTDKENAPVG